MQMLIHKIKLATRPYLTMENGVLVIALLIAMSLLWNTMSALQRNYQLQQQVDIMRQENELTELENQTLEFQKRYYESSEYLELSARQRLNKSAPGEKVIILPKTEPSPTQTTTTSPRIAAQQRTNMEQWIDFFFGIK